MAPLRVRYPALFVVSDRRIGDSGQLLRVRSTLGRASALNSGSNISLKERKKHRKTRCFLIGAPTGLATQKQLRIVFVSGVRQSKEIKERVL